MGNVPSVPGFRVGFRQDVLRPIHRRVRGQQQYFYSARYQVTGDGSFTYELGGVWNNRPVQDKDSGTLQLGGNLIIFKGRKLEQKYHFVNFQTAIDVSTVLTVLAGQEDPAKANVTSLQQQLVRAAKK